MRTIGTQAKGVRAPIITKGDDLVKIVADSIMDAAAEGNFELADRDIVGVTEAVVAKAQGNYASIDDIARDIHEKFDGKTLGLVFPILSRNRFSALLEGIAMGVDKVVVQLSYPSDEVGNHMLTLDMIDEKGVNPYSDNFTEEAFRETFGYETKHEFTQTDYIEYYKSIHPNIEIVFSNNPTYILEHADQVLCADIHTRFRTQRILQNAGCTKVLTLDDILSRSIDGSGYNDQYGILGSNKATDTTIKLFPRDTDVFVTAVQAELKNRTGKTLEVLVYGDGAFKDPQGKIWELADPVVSPAFTPGLEGTPNEIKLKYVAENDFTDLSGEALEEAIRESIRNKKADLKDSAQALGTTPRQIPDLLGSLCDLVTGSGDKGTPIVLIQGYFDNYSD